MKKKIGILAAALLTALLCVSLAACIGSKEKSFQVDNVTITLTDDYYMEESNPTEGIIEENILMTLNAKDGKSTIFISRMPKDELTMFNVFDLDGFKDFTYVYYESEADSEEYNDDNVRYIAYRMDFVDEFNNANSQLEALYEGDDYFYEAAFVCGRNDYDSLKEQFTKFAASLRADNLGKREGPAAKAVDIDGLTLNIDATYTGENNSYNNGALGIDVTVLNDPTLITLDSVINVVNAMIEFDFLTDTTSGGIEYAVAEGEYQEEGVNYYEVAGLYVGDSGGYVVEVSCYGTAVDYVLDAMRDILKGVNGQALENYKNNPVEVEAKTWALDCGTFSGSIALDNTYTDFQAVYDTFFAFSAHHNRAVYADVYGDKRLTAEYGTTDFGQVVDAEAAALIEGQKKTVETGLSVVYNQASVTAVRQLTGGIAFLQFMQMTGTDDALVDYAAAVMKASALTVKTPDFTAERVDLGDFTLELNKSFVYYAENEEYYSAASGISFGLYDVQDKSAGLTVKTFADDVYDAVQNQFNIMAAMPSGVSEGWYLVEGYDREADTRYFFVCGQTENYFVAQAYVFANVNQAINAQNRDTAVNFAKTLQQKAA